ncbi:spermidine sinapoyl-CoA acyltransferase [Beta vulgaris subsp. vulgaris]|uniref:spermidine sinapoyl-CoA acyltransferase n=1 Tax=Beta vulgaris subsp. vulgaris TaxID=3555 RepID=UPI002037084F|nr:spermidine sinapoyl-CoA acyltransferase [Beta vulgaris subsp. vulgaris]
MPCIKGINQLRKPPNIMEVIIQETTTIYPSNPPFNHPHTLSLSHLDTDLNLHVTFRYFRVYANLSNSNPFQLIKNALGTALGPYYPLTGTLRKLEGCRFELHCTPGKGVPIIRASVDYSLESLNYLDELDETFSERLVPNPGLVEAMDHPMILQITLFKCGGYVLGSAVHNMLCDGLGASEFFNGVAELARGVTRMEVEPVWERASLLGPREPVRVEFPFEEFLRLDKEFSPYLQNVGPTVRVCFPMMEKWLDRFKEYLQERSGSRFTTFEALGAFIWRARVKASNIPKDTKVKFAYLMNIRKLLNPPLPKGYWGNGCIQMYVQLTAGELTDQPIWKTASLIKHSKYNANDEYVRSYIDFQKENYEKGITAGKEVSGFTDWRHIGHSKVDFGSGGPVNVVPLSKHFLGSIEPCYFLPYSSVAVEGKEDGDGFKVLVCLRECAKDGFMAEMDKFSRLEFDLG